MPPLSQTGPLLAAIDVGTNSVRLKVARVLADGALEVVHEERDPVRPGEGVFADRVMRRDVADRLLSTLRRYGALCRRHRARVRAVATSAIREARNRDDIIARVRREAGLELEVVSGREEARLICFGVLRGKAEGARSLIIDVGGGSTEVALADGERPSHLWSLSLGAVRLAQIFDVNGVVGRKQLRVMRQYAAEAVAEVLPARGLRIPSLALGTSGTMRALIGYAAASGTGQVTRERLTRALERLAAMDVNKRRTIFDPRRADIIVSGATIIEAVAERLRLRALTAVDRGLRDGILVDLLRRRREVNDPSLTETALVLGRRFYFDEPHARQVAKLALRLFDDLADVHDLPASARPLLEAASLLHDVGNSVSYQRHHRHTHYLISNADLPGLSDQQRDLVARVARFHRGSPPEPTHALMAELPPPQAQLVRKLAVILRLADSFDRSHHQPVSKLKVQLAERRVLIKLHAGRPVDLELWDATHEAALFQSVFRRGLELSAGR